MNPQKRADRMLRQDNRRGKGKYPIRLGNKKRHSEGRIDATASASMLARTLIKLGNDDAEIRRLVFAQYPAWMCGKHVDSLLAARAARQLGAGTHVSCEPVNGKGTETTQAALKDRPMGADAPAMNG